MSVQKLEIDWRIPATKPGLPGALERFVGPGKSRGETLVELSGGALCAALIAAFMQHIGGGYDWSLWRIVVTALMIFDLLGGVLTTSTNSGKRWYHRPEPGMRRYRFQFVVSHVLYLVAVAYVLLPGDWKWLLVNIALLLVPAAAIELAPAILKRPAAIALYLSVVLIDLTWLTLPAALAWFPAVFFLKLLVCFLVPEAPIAAHRNEAAGQAGCAGVQDSGGRIRRNATR